MKAKAIFDLIISWIPVVLLSMGVICGVLTGLTYVYYWILSLVS